MVDTISFIDLNDVNDKEGQHILSIVTDKSENFKPRNGIIFETKQKNTQSTETMKPAVSNEGENVNGYSKGNYAEQINWVQDKKSAFSAKIAETTTMMGGKNEAPIFVQPPMLHNQIPINPYNMSYNVPMLSHAMPISYPSQEVPNTDQSSSHIKISKNKKKQKYKNNTVDDNTVSQMSSNNMPMPGYGNNVMCFYHMQDPNNYMLSYNIPSNMGSYTTDYISEQNYNQNYHVSNYYPESLDTTPQYLVNCNNYSYSQMNTVSNGCDMNNESVNTLSNTNIYYSYSKDREDQVSTSTIENSLTTNVDSMCFKNKPESLVNGNTSIKAMPSPTTVVMQEQQQQVNNRNIESSSRECVHSNSIVISAEKTKKKKNKKKKKKLNKELASGSSAGESGSNTRPVTPAPKVTTIVDVHKEEDKNINEIKMVQSDGSPPVLNNASETSTISTSKKSDDSVSELSALSNRDRKTSAKMVEDNTLTIAWGKKKSWSSIFGSSQNNCDNNEHTILPSVKNDSGKSIEEKMSPDNVHRMKIADTINAYKMGHTEQRLLPRGLINRNIWCYTNCLLQALIGCEPFLHLMQLFIKEVPELETLNMFPFLSSTAEFISMYSNVSEVLRPTHKGKVKPVGAVETAVPCEPACIYNLLLTVGSYQFEEVNQQDAQEALNFILNGLHEEIADCLGVNGWLQPNTIEDGDDWQVKGPKGKSCVARTTPFHQTPFSEIFWGEFRYMRTASGTNSANIEPFNTLLLDVQSPKVKTLEDAFDQLVSKEIIQGYTCSKTKQKTTMVKKGLLQSLPKVLILHLNRFTYGEKGLLKDNKRVDYDMELEIRKDLIYQKKRKDKKNERSYTLFAVVKHEGPMATKGHYICEVCHGSKWLRFDDSNVKCITLEDVLKYNESLVPYLLFYQRNDTIHQFTNGNA